MHIDTIRTALHRSPFMPFILRLVDGRSLWVPHPDFIAVSPRHVLVVNPQDESVVWVEPLLVVSLDFLPSQAGTASGNGAQDSSGSS